MSDKLAMTAIICSTIMYSVAVVCVAVVRMHGPPTDTAEAFAAKLLAVFGPIVTLLTALVFRRNGPPKEKS